MRLPLLNRSLFLVGVAAAMAVMVISAVLTVLHLRQEAESRAVVTTQNLAQSIELTIEGLIKTIDVGLLGSVDEIQRQLATGRPDAQVINRHLNRTGTFTAVAYQRATDEHGDIIYGPDHLSPTVNVADRDYFLRLRDDYHASLLVGNPIFGRISKQWVWTFARRINKPNGSFGGIIFASIPVDQLSQLLAQIKLDPGSIAVRDASFGLIVRRPAISGISIPVGSRQLSAPFIEALKVNPREGSYVSGATSIDGINRTHSYRVSSNYAFSVNVGIPVDAMLAQWRQQAAIILGLTTALALVMLVLAVLIQRVWQRQAQDLAALQVNQQALYEAQEIAGLGQYVYDLQADRWTSSELLDGILGIGPDHPRDAASWLQLVAPEARAGMQAHLQVVISQQQLFDSEYPVVRANDGQRRWVHGKGKLKFDEQGAPHILIGTIQDITGHRLADQQQRIAAIAFESQEGMFITDAAQVIVRVNQAFTRITGYSAEEAVGQTPKLLNSGRHDTRFYVVMRTIIARKGSWQGEIWNRRKNGEIYPEWLSITEVKNADGQTTNFVATLTDITVRKSAETEIRNLAFYDPLTRLPNRRLMVDRLGQALTACVRHQRHGAVMLLDLDNFKTLNDTLGHAVGDQLLIEVAARLQASIREGDTVARLGGDEFVVILEDLDQNGLAALQAESVAQKILRHLCAPYQLDVAQDGGVVSQRSHHCTSSIGITLFRDDPVTVDELIKRADTAMYQAKASGRNTMRFFDPEMQDVVTARAALEASLRDAVQKKEFVLYYQAQVTDEGRWTGAEALVRWQHPQRGVVTPGEFIAAAEEAGLILPLGQWVLEGACAQLARWATQSDMAHLTIAVNVSAHQFRQRQFVEQVVQAMERSAINPQRLKLELTESLLVQDVEDVIAKMTELKTLGVGFSLDDFGTGYSSLSYLKRLPLDQLKIDQGFIRDSLLDPNDAAIAKMVIALGQSLNLAVIAEGVETPAQRDYLASLGCRSYQGYLFCKPLPIDAFEAHMRLA